MPLYHTIMVLSKVYSVTSNSTQHIEGVKGVRAMGLVLGVHRVCAGGQQEHANISASIIIAESRQSILTVDRPTRERQESRGACINRVVEPTGVCNAGALLMQGRNTVWTLSSWF